MKMTIGAFLLSRLTAMGLSRIYGVPGDYNLEFLEALAEHPALSFVGTCNELNAAYAADGDARLTGIGAVLTTYGVGDLAALSGIAGSYAEGVPVLSISGAPPLHAIRSRALVHHTLADGNFDNVMNCFREFTAAQGLIAPENAADVIDRVLQACWREKRPAYLQLPSDICSIEIDAPDRPLPLERASSDGDLLAEAVSHIVRRLAQAKQPLLLLDSIVRSHRLTRQVEYLVERLGLDFATLGPAKAVLDESSQHFIGMYNGKASAKKVIDRVAKSDCLLCFGTRFVDSTSGWFSQVFDADAVISINPFDVMIGADYFPGVGARDLLEAIISCADRAGSSCSDNREGVAHIETGTACDAVWSQDGFWDRIGRFIEPGDVVLAENGTSLAGMSRLEFPKGCDFISQPIWGAIGYTLPALLGTSLAAPDRRQLLFIGDGSFQLTGQELSTILRLGLRPVIFLINNGGYTIERFILGDTSPYNDVANWSYTGLPSVFAPNTRVNAFVVSNHSQLEASLTVARDSSDLNFIEVKFDSMDSPSGMPAFGKMARDYDYGRSLHKPLGEYRTKLCWF